MWLRCAIMALALSLSFGTREVSAQYRTEKVCWGEKKTQCGMGYEGKETRFFACGSGRHSGFDADYVCEQVCGARSGPRCKIENTNSRVGHRCGYTRADITCYR